MRAPAWPYAEVAVEVPATRGAGPPTALSGPLAEAEDTFHYSVPPSLAGRVQAGQRVRVPFGRRQVNGVVVALRRQSPVERTRDISATLDSEPVIGAPEIALARWVSARYLARFHSCLKLFLPPGGEPIWERRFRRSDKAIELDEMRQLGEQARAILGQLSPTRYAAEAAVLAEVKPARAAAEALAQLVEQGLAQVETQLRPARTRPKRIRMATLLVSEEAEIDPALRRLKPDRRAELLAWLGQGGAELPTVEDALEASGADRAALRDLEKRGHVTVSAAERSLSTPLRGDALQAALDGDLARAPAQARLLQALAAAEAPQPEAQILKRSSSSKATLEALLKAGHARRLSLPSSVLPSLRGGRLREAEMAWRKADRHAEALAFLAAAGGQARAATLTKETRATARVLRELEAAGLISLDMQQIWRDPLEGQDFPQPQPPTLTADQDRAWRQLRPLLGQGAWSADAPLASFATRPNVALLHGVTGSGKTELYLRAIEQALLSGRQAIVLVPEIALTPQTIRRFAGRFPGRVGVWHSQLSEGERLDTWQRAKVGLLDVIVGSRSALFAPLPRLGLVVVDECHAPAYKQSQSPRYQARDLAIRRAALSGALCILGSATPGVETYWRAQRGEYRLLELPRRVVKAASAPTTRDQTGATHDWGELPPVDIVDMRSELRAGNTSMFSRALEAGLREVLEDGRQAILFLNRRGSSTFVLCRDCGHVLACPRCSAPLIWHRAGAKLTCHRCNHREPPPMLCPACGGQRIRYFGAGTEKVEEAAHEAFPEARIVRWDADTTGGKGAHEAILAAFVSGQADILVGTQMVAKGLDLPRVTLVGVVSGDTGLHFPDFRAAERSFQLLSQVAGRAGRSALGGRVILQTYAPEHPAIVSAAAHDYAGFYAREIAFRQKQVYPPFSQLVRLLHLHEHDRSAQREAQRVANALRARMAELGLAETQVLGPAPAFFHRVRGRSRWQILIKGPSPRQLLAEVNLGQGWRVDVDPVDML